MRIHRWLRIDRVANHRTKALPVVLLAATLGACAVGDQYASPTTSSSDTPSRVRLAEAARGSGDFSAAARLYQEAVQKQPDDPALHLALADVLLKAEDAKDAEREAATAVQLAPKDAATHLLHGKALLALHRLDPAIAEFDLALARDRNAVPAMNAKAVALDQKGMHAQALAIYRHALEIAPNDLALLNNLGLSLALAGQYEEAIDTLSKVIEEDGATPRNRENLALALALKGRSDDAARVMRADLDEAHVQSNLQYFDAVRQLTGH